MSRWLESFSADLLFALVSGALRGRSRWWWLVILAVSALPLTMAGVAWSRAAPVAAAVFGAAALVLPIWRFVLAGRL